MLDMQDTAFHLYFFAVYVILSICFASARIVVRHQGLEALGYPMASYFIEGFFRNYPSTQTSPLYFKIK